MVEAPGGGGDRRPAGVPRRMGVRGRDRAARLLGHVRRHQRPRRAHRAPSRDRPRDLWCVGRRDDRVLARGVAARARSRGVAGRALARWPRRSERRLLPARLPRCGQRLLDRHRDRLVARQGASRRRRGRGASHRCRSVRARAPDAQHRAMARPRGPDPHLRCRRRAERDPRASPSPTLLSRGWRNASSR